MIAEQEKGSSSITSVTPAKSIRQFSDKIITAQQLNMLLGGGIVEEDALGI
jgi:hypothetical protein